MDTDRRKKHLQLIGKSVARRARSGKSMRVCFITDNVFITGEKFRANSLFSLFLSSFTLQSESGRSFYRQGSRGGAVLPGGCIPPLPPPFCMVKYMLKCSLQFRANSLFSLFLSSFPLQSESGRSFYRQGHVGWLFLTGGGVLHHSPLLVAW